MNHIILTVVIVLLIVILVLSVKLFQLNRQHKLLKSKKERLPAMDVGSETEMFRHKLNPHLLKNALNAIQSHAYQSYYALDKLYNVLDYILYESDGSFVPLEDELSFALNLIEINRLKTSPLFNLQVKNKIHKDDSRLAGALIAPFISINPIENAFKHADFLSDNSFISISFEIAGGWFVLSVSNKTLAGSPRPASKGGLGNKTFLNRLRSVYQDSYQFDQSETDGVYFVKLIDSWKKVLRTRSVWLSETPSVLILKP